MWQIFKWVNIIQLWQNEGQRFIRIRNEKNDYMMKNGGYLNNSPSIWDMSYGAVS